MREFLDNLHKSDDERWIFGVCGGIAETADIEPWVIRFIFFMLLISGGGWLFVYIILAIVLPEGKK